MLTDTQHHSSLNGLVERLQRNFTVKSLGPWKLDHRLLRSDKSSPRWQNVLQLGHFPRKVFIGIEPPQESANSKKNDDPLCISTIPQAQKDSYNTLLATKLSLLWIPRSDVSTSNGVAYEVGDNIVRLGELRAAGSGQGLRGVLVSIQIPSEEVAGGTMEKDDETTVKTIIKEIWHKFGIEGAKEAWGFGGEAGEIKAWCEILKTR